MLKSQIWNGHNFLFRKKAMGYGTCVCSLSLEYMYFVTCTCTLLCYNFLRPLLLPSTRQGKCRLMIVNNSCEVGLRQRTYHVLSGSILGVWTHVEGVFNRHSSHGQRMQIVRVRAPNKRLVGKRGKCMYS